MAACSRSQPPGTSLSASSSVIVAQPSSSSVTAMNPKAAAKPKGKTIIKSTSVTKPKAKTSRRGDIAVIKNATRGDKQMALKIAADPELLQDAIR